MKRVEKVPSVSLCCLIIIVCAAGMPCDMPTFAMFDVTHVISHTRLPLFSLAYVEKDWGAWG